MGPGFWWPILQTADGLLSYCKAVRQKTMEYLDTIDDSTLKEVPDRGEVENYDPVREEFVKLIWMQSFVLGKLVTIAQMIAGQSQKIDRPDFSASGHYWENIQT